eukprot:CAMPEP_0118938312 /NCGR_PEP_ID=MMETSP1169-20130426/25457_1 /TAXON_ID=36882 /ORGANISM="Pyramimonas obovata, Strain CCMP722" /LENGTH=307 /DNA_ID=CAMNT_0006882211 /DNA_START=146 /DNA_END=1066 /DNA_ORIENTATION=+
MASATRSRGAKVDASKNTLRGTQKGGVQKQKPNGGKAKVQQKANKQTAQPASTRRTSQAKQQSAKQKVADALRNKAKAAKTRNTAKKQKNADETRQIERPRRGAQGKPADAEKETLGKEKQQPTEKRPRGRPRKDGAQGKPADAVKKTLGTNKTGGIGKKQQTADEKRSRGRPRKDDAQGKPATKAGKAEKSQAPKKVKRQYFPNMMVEDEVFKVGDFVYTIGENGMDFEEADELCVKCNKDADHATMIECDGCLRGWHLKCLQPPLKKVPEGDWLCPGCADRLDSTGVVEALPETSRRTAREAFVS